MGVAFFSSLALCAGGALVRHSRKNMRRRKLLKRYAERVARLLENRESVLEAFRRDPQKIVRRERRLCGTSIELELRASPKPPLRLRIRIRDHGSFLNKRFPVTHPGKNTP